MKQISTQQLSALIGYLKAQPWEQVHPLITMLSSLPAVEVKKDTSVTPKKYWVQRLNYTKLYARLHLILSIIE